MARPGKSSAAARRSWDFLFGAGVLSRVVVLPSSRLPFGPGFLFPPRCVARCLSASLAFQGGLGVFPFRDAFVLLASPSLLGPGFP